jgi:hypothetical protein
MDVTRFARRLLEDAPMRVTELSVVMSFAVLGAACGGAAPPPPTMASAEAGIRAAREVGAPSDPQGALHLSLAQEELDKAKKLYADGDAKTGELVLARAAVDAELALAEAHAAQSRAQTQQAVDQVKLLKATQR